MLRNRPLLQLVFPAAAVSLLLAIVCLMAIWSFDRLQMDRTRTLAKEMASLVAAQEIEVRLRQLRIHALVYVMEPTAPRRAVLEEDYRQIEEAMMKATLATNGPEETQLLQTVRKGHEKYRLELEDRSKLPPPNSPLPAYLAWSDTHLMSPLLESCETLVAMNRRSLALTEEANERFTSRTRLGLTLVGLFGPLAGLVGGVVIAWRWSRNWNEKLLELEHAEHMAAVGHLAAGVSHEVRNPLTGMKMLIQAALQSGKSSEITTEDLNMMLNDLGRVERTVQGLLDYAKPSTGLRQVLDVNNAIRRIVDSERGRATSKEVEIKLEATAAAITIAVDPDQFSTMVSNLIINAIEASPVKGQILVTIAETQQHALQIRVADQGSGIAPNQFPKLFTPFATNKPNGTGLGLCLARRVARYYGGDITADNIMNSGARFTIELPLAES